MTLFCVTNFQGKGFPDLATRHFLHVLCNCSPELPVYGIADADPYGLSIMHSYRVGSRNSISNEERYECGRLNFIGMDILDFQDESLPLSKADWQMAYSTIGKEWILQPEYAFWKKQLQMQMFLMRKAELNIIGDESDPIRVARKIQILIGFKK